jgi:hypothetical protein
VAGAAGVATAATAEDAGTTQETIPAGTIIGRKPKSRVSLIADRVSLISIDT